MVKFVTIFNIHGGKIATLFYLLTRAFEYVYEFLLYGNVTDEELKSIVDSNINKLGEIVGLIDGNNDDELVEHANNMIGDLMFNYRNYFMLFGELKGEMPLSPEVTQKIREIIANRTGIA